jgi:hypothetical protein
VGIETSSFGGTLRAWINFFTWNPPRTLGISGPQRLHIINHSGHGQRFSIAPKMHIVAAINAVLKRQAPPKSGTDQLLDLLKDPYAGVVSLD